MAILNRDDFFSRLHERLGEDTTDEAISFMEDMTDTYNSLESRANGDGVDWKHKYEENDKAWKKKYQSRFFHGYSGSIPPTEPQSEDNGYEPENITIDSLFE